MTGRETIGSRLAQLRREKAAQERRDITQALAAEELGASPAAYSRWESDLRKPNEMWLSRLARYFGTTVPFIHYGVGMTTPASQETGAATIMPYPALEDRVPDEEVSAEIAREAARKQGAQRKAGNGPRKRR